MIRFEAVTKLARLAHAASRFLLHSRISMITSCNNSKRQENVMSVDLVLGGITALGLGLYLVYALIHPEKF